MFQDISAQYWGSICLVFALGAAACTHSDAEVAAKKRVADSLIQAQSPTVCIKNLSAQIRKQPENYALYADRAACYHRAQRTDSAIMDMDAAIFRFPTGVELYYERGAYRFAINDTPAALRDFRKAAALGSKNPENFYQMGQLFFLRNDYSTALKYYDTALKLDSTVAHYWFAKGFLFENEKKYTQAETLYNKALKKDPRFIKAIVQMYKLYSGELNDPKKAKYCADKVLETDPRHPLGHFIQANISFDKARTQQPNTSEYQQNIKDAIMEYTVAVNRDTNFVQAYYNRGYSFFLAGNQENALQDFQRVVALQPNHARAQFMLGSIYEYYKDYAAALTHYREAVAANPTFVDAQKAVKEVERKAGIK